MVRETGQATGTGRQRHAMVRWLSLIGITGPVIFWVVVLVLGVVTPGYDTVSDVMSDLAAVNAPYAIVQQVNFILLGVGILAVAIGLDRLVRDGRRPSIGLVLVGIFGLGVIGSGIFQTNPANRATTTQMLHSAFSLVAFLAGLLGTPLASWRLAHNERWPGYHSRPTVLGITGIVFGAFVVFLLSNGTAWSGLAQRLFAGVLSAWVVYHAYELYQVTEKV